MNIITDKDKNHLLYKAKWHNNYISNEVGDRERSDRSRGGNGKEQIPRVYDDRLKR